MAMGYDVLSMNSNNLPRVKSAIRGTSLARANGLLQRVMRMDDAEAIHHYLRDALKEMGLSNLVRPTLPEQD